MIAKLKVGGLNMHDWFPMSNVYVIVEFLEKF